MKKTNISIFNSGDKNKLETTHKLKVELRDHTGLVILRQFIDSKVNDIYEKLNFHFLPAGKYALKIEGKKFAKFMKIKISEN